MDLDSIISAGLFLGTSIGIKAASPDVLISYVIVGFIVVLVIQILDEMAAVHPTPDSFSTYAKVTSDPSAGPVFDWLCQFMLTVVLGAKTTGTGATMSAQSGIPDWIPGLVCAAFFAVVNLMNMRDFDEFKFWFAFIKVTAIIAFLIIGVLLFFGLLPGTSFVDTAHTARSGFLPNGMSGTAAGLLAAALISGSIEIVAVATAEAEGPQRSITTAARPVIFRISVFCLGCAAVTILLLSYSQTNGADSATESPFAQILKQASIPGAADFMEAIIILALPSVLNAQIYATSRLVYSISTCGKAPHFFAHINEGAAPNRTVIIPVILVFVSMDLQVVSDGSGILVFLLNIVGDYLLVIWLVIALSEIKLRPQVEANNESFICMQAYPVLSWITVILIMGPATGMSTDPGTRQQVIAVICVTVFLAVLATLTKGNHIATRKALEPSDSD